MKERGGGIAASTCFISREQDEQSRPVGRPSRPAGLGYPAHSSAHARVLTSCYPCFHSRLPSRGELATGGRGAFFGRITAISTTPITPLASPSALTPLVYLKQPRVRRSACRAADGAASQPLPCRRLGRPHRLIALCEASFARTYIWVKHDLSGARPSCKVTLLVVWKCQRAFQCRAVRALMRVMLSAQCLVQ